MKKFMLTIFGATIFFLGLGGIAKQVASKFQRERTDSVKTFTFVREPQDFLLRSTREKISENDLKIRLPMPPPPDNFSETCEFDRRPENENSNAGAAAAAAAVGQLPRNVGGKRIIIIKRSANLKETPQEKERFPQVRVYFDKENDTE